ncbi:hypothetical protein [Enterobacter roggenkampii]|uniref:Uncharacterized protein n=1 Tax=Enterobacter mori TaxID=539813 RepID=A0A7T0GXQ0_9ENTR|nr:hypothetical protein [Enterobacter mori]QPJ98886.1 hypothetical protein IDM36_13145 [Enterobacter mori]
MAQGLQCWDSSGRLVVDLTDYSIRYMGSMSISFSAGETQKNFSFPGLTQDGSFVTIVSASLSGYTNEYYCRSYNGGFTAYRLPTSGGPAITFNIEAYNFQ